MNFMKRMRIALAVSSRKKYEIYCSKSCYENVFLDGTLVQDGPL